MQTDPLPEYNRARRPPPHGGHSDLLCALNFLDSNVVPQIWNVSYQANYYLLFSLSLSLGNKCVGVI